jgi:hypothetical protein
MQVARVGLSRGSASLRATLYPRLSLPQRLTTIPTLSPLRRNLSQSRTLRQSGFKIPPWLTISNARKFWPQIVAGGAGLVVVYGLSSMMYWVAGTLMTLDFEDVFWFGFGTGVVRGSAILDRLAGPG